MAVRGWGGSVATAAGAAAGVGAAQLGLGYGLDIVAWLPVTNAATEANWVSSLAWTVWIAATSTVAGALIADRLAGSTTTSPASSRSASAARGRPADRSAASEVGPFSTALWRLALAVAAAVGALVTVALVAVPARAAVPAEAIAPERVAGEYAVIGVVVGMLVAVGALASRAVAANILATMAWLWLLAVAAVVYGVAGGGGAARPQLGAWHLTGSSSGFWFRNMYLPGVALSLGSALVIGALAAWPAARRGEERIGIPVSGAVGPLLVAIAYLLAAPRPVGVPAEQLSAYLVAPYAVITGLAGSVLLATMSARPRPVRAAPGATTDLADDAYAPARAYVSEEAGAPEPARGQAAVKTPLWPQAASPDPPRGDGPSQT